MAGMVGDGMKNFICIISGICGAIIAELFGGWSAALTTLVIFMLIDYVLGIITGICGKSTKTENGKLSSSAAFSGIVKKFIMLAIIVIAYRLDVLTGTGYMLRDGTAIAFITSECLSIIENAAVMGVPMPSIIKKALEVLKNEK